MKDYTMNKVTVSEEVLLRARELFTKCREKDLHFLRLEPGNITRRLDVNNAFQSATNAMRCLERGSLYQARMIIKSATYYSKNWFELSGLIWGL